MWERQPGRLDDLLLNHPTNEENDMKESPGNAPRVRRNPSTRRIVAAVAAILAVVQACLTIEGMGIEGFVLWVIILFAGYWLLFTFLIWVWRRFRDRA